jgi:hypothetical protein
MRIQIRSAFGAAALGASAVLFFATPGAVAANGDPVLAGQGTGETVRTLVADINKYGAGSCDTDSFDFAFVACSTGGLLGKGTSTGVKGLVGGGGTAVGVEGSAGSGATGVYGHNGGSTGIGVWGQTAGTGSAVYGQAMANGIGVNAVSVGGTGVQGESDASNGTAVKATAKAGDYAKAIWGVSDTGYGGYFEAPGGFGYGVYASGGEFGVKALGGPTGLYASGSSNGVEGHGGNNGVEGDIGTGGTAGVYGHASGTAGYGVAGSGPTGVYGAGATAGVEGGSGAGSGVYGHAQGGIGVRAEATSGTALQVTGKAKFSRSGIVTVPAGSASTTVSLAGVTASSMVVATAQQNGSVFVKAAVPAGGSFKIFLTGNAPAGGLKVAYFVLN